METTGTRMAAKDRIKTNTTPPPVFDTGSRAYEMKTSGADLFLLSRQDKPIPRQPRLKAGGTMTGLGEAG